MVENFWRKKKEGKNDERKRKLGGNNLLNQVFKKPVSLNKKNRRKEKEERGSFQKAVARPTSRLLEKERDREFFEARKSKRESESVREGR